MPANSDVFPWPSYYRKFPFFEKRMGAHEKVATLKEINEGLYELTTINGRLLRIFICECYAFGMAEYFESVENLGHLDVIIIDSNWCGYATEVKRYCRDNKIGLFKVGEFMGALNREDYWNYLTDDQLKYFRSKGWL